MVPRAIQSRPQRDSGAPAATSSRLGWTMSQTPSAAIAATIINGQKPAPGDLGLPTPNPHAAATTGIAVRMAPTPRARSTVIPATSAGWALLLHGLADLVVHGLHGLAEILAVQV